MATVLFACGPGARNLCTASITDWAVACGYERQHWVENLPAYIGSGCSRPRWQSHLPLVHSKRGAADYVAVGCSAMAPTDYTDRYNQVASSIHWNICLHFKVKWKGGTGINLIGVWRRKTLWWCGIRPSPLQRGDQSQTFVSKTDPVFLLISAVLLMANSVGMHATKLAKYGDLRVEICRMCYSGGSCGIGCLIWTQCTEACHVSGHHSM